MNRETNRSRNAKLVVGRARQALLLKEPIGYEPEINIYSISDSTWFV
jgi:hypothetical protein